MLPSVVRTYHQCRNDEPVGKGNRCDAGIGRLDSATGPLSGQVSEVLNRKRALSLRMVKRLHEGLKIPYESLLSRAA